ncbi:hypothetical protein [Velocimicrobium porci]|uniref:Uncharacterized protein n=1 Tax=Velocimicrobium porci TaxID=2606634 RepID=A0A6L5XWG2_9FIRM|nr:hypothetical protein [Velocimicrobium porci]MSS62363.1 hypothetical protein [Velocimicrobium porci]
MTKKLKFFRYVSNLFFIISLLSLLYNMTAEKVNIIVFASSFLSFLLFYLIAYIGWRCPKCKKRLPIRATTYLDKCRNCGYVFSESVHLKKEKSEAQIIKEFDEIVSKSIIRFVISVFIVLLSVLLCLFKHMQYIWITIIIITILYNIYFVIAKDRCPNCHHIIPTYTRYGGIAKHCPCCGVKLRN